MGPSSDTARRTDTTSRWILPHHTTWRRADKLSSRCQKKIHTRTSPHKMRGNVYPLTCAEIKASGFSYLVTRINEHDRSPFAGLNVPSITWHPRADPIALEIRFQFQVMAAIRKALGKNIIMRDGLSVGAAWTSICVSHEPPAAEPPPAQRTPSVAQTSSPSGNSGITHRTRAPPQSPSSPGTADASTVVAGDHASGNDVGVKYAGHSGSDNFGGWGEGSGSNEVDGRGAGNNKKGVRRAKKRNHIGTAGPGSSAIGCPAVPVRQKETSGRRHRQRRQRRPQPPESFSPRKERKRRRRGGGSASRSDAEGILSDREVRVGNGVRRDDSMLHREQQRKHAISSRAPLLFPFSLSEGA